MSFSSSVPGSGPVPEPLSREVARAVLAAVRLERLGLRGARCLATGPQVRRLGAALLVLREIQLVLFQVSPEVGLGDVTIGSCGRITLRVSSEIRQPGGVRAADIARDLSVALRLVEAAPDQGCSELRRWSGPYLGWPVTILATDYAESVPADPCEQMDVPDTAMPSDRTKRCRSRGQGARPRTTRVEDGTW